MSDLIDERAEDEPPEEMESYRKTATRVEINETSTSFIFVSHLRGAPQSMFSVNPCKRGRRERQNLQKGERKLQICGKITGPEERPEQGQSRKSGPRNSAITITGER
jgi:hypothetical protein